MTSSRPAGAGAGENQNNKHKGDHQMAYKKPQIVAKSAAKQSFVAGCPPKTRGSCSLNKSCEISPAK